MFDAFATQITRLKDTFGEKYYTTERVRVIALALRGIEPAIMERVVTRLIATRRVAPLLRELLEACEEVRSEDKQAARERVAGSSSFMGQLEDAARKDTGTADPEFVKACLKHLRERLDGKTTMEQFREGCGYLNQVAAELSKHKTTRAAVPQRTTALAYRTGENDD